MASGDKIICPWCGAEMEEHLTYASGRGRKEYKCPKCSAKSPPEETREQARAAALRRYTPPNRGCEPVITGETSDGYHTFNELYHHRAVLFSVIVKAFPEKAWKAKKHDDGSMYDGMFIVGIETPDGQATYHYDIDPYWWMFKCRELEYAPEWDGHTAAQAIERIGKLEPERHGRWKSVKEPKKWGSTVLKCTECGLTDYGSTFRYFNYCPGCGAKMYKEEK